jgi:hypothetical protein
VLAATPTEHLEAEVMSLARRLHSGTYELLSLVGELDERGAYATWGALSCAAWLADVCDIEVCTARTQVRVARLLRVFPVLDEAMATGAISYAKARTLAGHLSDDNVDALVTIARTTPAGRLGAAIAAWSLAHEDQGVIDERQHDARSLSWHTAPDGMVVFTIKVPPQDAGRIEAIIDTEVIRHDPIRTARAEPVAVAPSVDAPAGASALEPAATSPRGPALGGSVGSARSAGSGGQAESVERVYPSLSQQRADALLRLLDTADDPDTDADPDACSDGDKDPARDGDADAGRGADIPRRGRTRRSVAEVVVHVRPGGNTLADGTPLSDHAVGRMLPDAFVSLLIEDNDRHPIDASPRRRFPTRRQRRVIDARDPECAQDGCHARDRLQYDHREPFDPNNPNTVIANLQRLCGPHNRAKGNQSGMSD